MLSPDGSKPKLTAHVYGGDPPVALSPCKYAAPTAPGGSEAVVIVSTGELMVSGRVTVADVDELSVTLTVNLDGPIAVAVPYIIPLEFRLSPSGSEPFTTDQVYGRVPPVALSACE
jgi:hypothetical protein